MKRKRSPNDSSDDPDHPEQLEFPGSAAMYAGVAAAPTLSTTDPRGKRRRTSTLERGFAHLSLTPNLRTAATPIIAPVIELPSSDSSASLPLDVDMNPVGPEISELPSSDYPVPLLASSVAEAESNSPSTEPQEIKMKGTSWYEPEKDRIVITDLDEFEEDEDEYKQEIETHPDSDEWADSNASLTVSSALLAHIKKALILFHKPLPLPNVVTDVEYNANSAPTPTPVNSPPVTILPKLLDEDDSMDVEL